MVVPVTTCIVFPGLLGAPGLLRKDGVGSLWVPKSLPALIYLEVGVRVGLSHSLNGLFKQPMKAPWSQIFFPPSL